MSSINGKSGMRLHPKISLTAAPIYLDQMQVDFHTNETVNFSTATMAQPFNKIPTGGGLRKTIGRDNCFYCGLPGHVILGCGYATADIAAGLIQKDSQGKLCLDESTYIPDVPNALTIREKVLRYYELQHASHDPEVCDDHNAIYHPHPHAITPCLSHTRAISTEFDPLYSYDPNTPLEEHVDAEIPEPWVPCTSSSPWSTPDPVDRKFSLLCSKRSFRSVSDIPWNLNVSPIDDELSVTMTQEFLGYVTQNPRQNIFPGLERCHQLLDDVIRRLNRDHKFYNSLRQIRDDLAAQASALVYEQDNRLYAVN